MADPTTTSGGVAAATSRPTPSTTSTGAVQPGADWLLTVQGQVDAATQRLGDPNTPYNAQLAKLQQQLGALDPATDPSGFATEPIKAQIAAYVQLRDSDRQMVATYAPQVSQELARRQQAAKQAGTLSPKEEAELDARIRLYQKQQTQIDAQMQADDLKNQAANDPTNKKLASDATQAQTYADNAAADANEAQAAHQIIANGFTADELTQANRKAKLANDDAERTLAAGGPEAAVDVTKAAAARDYAAAKASGSEVDVNNEKLRVSKLGDLGAFIDATAEMQKQGLIDQATADRLVQSHVSASETGATPYQWQTQADTNLTNVSDQLVKSGAMVRSDQPYMVGGDPGGAIQQALARYGLQFPTTQLNPIGAPAYAQSLGLTTSQPQAAASNGGGAPAYMASVTGPPDLSHLTPDQVDALMTGKAGGFAGATSNVNTNPGAFAGAKGGVNTGATMPPWARAALPAGG